MMNREEMEIVIEKVIVIKGRYDDELNSDSDRRIDESGCDDVEQITNMSDRIDMSGEQIDHEEIIL